MCEAGLLEDICHQSEWIHHQALPEPSGCDLSRKAWVNLNRIRIGFGRTQYFLHKTGAEPSPGFALDFFAWRIVLRQTLKSWRIFKKSCRKKCRPKLTRYWYTIVNTHFTLSIVALISRKLTATHGQIKVIWPKKIGLKMCVWPWKIITCNVLSMVKVDLAVKSKLFGRQAWKIL